MPPKKSIANKDVTLNDLASMISRGFDAQNEHFDKRFDKIEDRLDKVENRLDHMDVRLDHIDIRLARVERDVDEIKERMIKRPEFDDVLARVKYLEVRSGIESGIE